MSLEIDPKEINKYVADKILNSALGDALRKVIDEEVAKLTRSYDNPLAAAVQREVQGMLVVLIREEYGEKIKAAVREQLTDKAILEVSGRAIDALLRS